MNKFNFLSDGFKRLITVFFEKEGDNVCFIYKNGEVVPTTYQSNSLSSYSNECTFTPIENVSTIDELKALEKLNITSYNK